MVVKGSWGANQGIEQGDVIVSVNGKKVSAMKDLAERRALMEDPATELTFQFQRPAERAVVLSGTLHDKTPGCRLKGRKVNQLADSGFAVDLGIQVGDELCCLNNSGYTELTDDEKIGMLTKLRPLPMMFRSVTLKAKTNPYRRPGNAGGWSLFGACCTSCAGTNSREEIVIEPEASP